MQTVNHELEPVIRNELQPGEKIAWQSGMNPRRAAKDALFFVVIGIVGTVGTLVGMVWIAMSFESMADGNSSVFVPTFCLVSFSLFLLVDLAILSAPHWKAKMAAASAYVLTDKRAIFFEAKLRGGMKIRSFLPHEMTDIHCVQHANGSGDVILAKETRTGSKGGQYTINHGFLSINNAQAIESLVLALQNSPVQAEASGHAPFSGLPAGPRQTVCDESGNLRL